MDTLQLKPTNAPAIYSEGKIKTVNGVITLEDNILRYFMNIVDQNSVAISVDTTLLTVQEGQTLSFEFTVYSTKQCTLNFDGFNAMQYPIWRGLTKFQITKYAGTSLWLLEFKSADYKRDEVRVFRYNDLANHYYWEIDRTGNFENMLNAELDVYHENWNTPIGGGRKIYIHSVYGVLLTRFQINVNRWYDGRGYQYPTAIKIYGSNDNQTWHLIGQDVDCYASYKAWTPHNIFTNYPENTYYRHFRIEFFAEGQNECRLPSCYFFGYVDPNLTFIYERIIPFMTSSNQAGAQLLADPTNAADIGNVQNFSPQWIRNARFTPRWINNDKSKPITVYARVNSPRIPALIGLAHYGEYDHYPANYWRLYASNDETIGETETDETLETFQAKNWELIACTQKGHQYFWNGEIEYKQLNCTKAYKYYKFEAVNTYYGNHGWYFGGMILYYKEYCGNIPEFDSFIPKLDSTSQDGYMVSCSSEDDGGVLNAFNKNNNSYCGGQISTTTGDWILTMKLASKTIVKTLAIFAQDDDLYRLPRDFTFEASQDTTEWTPLLSVVNDNRWWPKERKAWTFENETAYLWYRLRVTGTYHGSRVRIGEIALGAQEIIPSQSYYRDENIVPVLTSHNQDGYEVTCSSVWNNDSGHQAYFLFDRNSNTKWASAESQTAEWVQIKLPEAKSCGFMHLVTRSDGNFADQAPRDFEIRGSNDGENWTTLITQTGVSWTGNGQDQAFEIPENKRQAFIYYRLVITANNKGYGAYSFGDWNLVQRKYISSEIVQGIPITRRALVPLMSSSSKNGYIVTASSEWADTAAAWRAFNRSVSGAADMWQSSQMTDESGLCSDVWIQVELPNPRVCNLLVLKPRTDSTDCKPRTPKTFTLNGSNDGTNWTELLNVTDGGGYDSDKEWSIQNITAYKYYRMNITATYAANQEISIGELELFKNEGIDEQ